MKIEKIYKNMAKKRGIPVSQVRAEMRKAVAAAKEAQGLPPALPTDKEVEDFINAAAQKATKG